MTELYQQIKSVIEFGMTAHEIPEYISNNVKYDFFDWQKKSIEYFLVNENRKKVENKQTHLMFNMATGAGKTLVMAAMILYYYKQGYRHFIFFVNQNNIVGKTENNFLDKQHNKYLFTDNIIIDNQLVNLKKVETFSIVPQGIEIKFTTVQKLYNDIHLERENQTTLDDLWQQKIVMLADEAHHLNTSTNAKCQQELIISEMTDKTSQIEIERKGWEHTVIEYILKKNSNKPNDNVLLEFTATVPSLPEAIKKYQDKTIIKFDLKEFMQAGYTKEINLISSTLDKKPRILQALLFNWYRHKLALKHDIPNFKPVILFRSKTIDDSQSDYAGFNELIDNLRVEDFNFIQQIDNLMKDSQDIYEQGKSRMNDLLKFIQTNQIKFEEIIEFIQYNFAEKNLIITNSDKNSSKTEKTTSNQEQLLNSLEDKDNHIRAIFTVKRLTEGWDVLNLFDIVRLYEGQNSGGKTDKVPPATTEEKQLIGRGVRYYPFSYGEKISNKRKFDDDVTNELRIMEELFYHTYDEDSRYISELKKALREDGMIQDNRVYKTFNLKDSFMGSDFYKSVKVWENRQIENPQRKKNSLANIAKDFFGTYQIKNLQLNQEQFQSHDRVAIGKNENKTITIKIKDIDRNLLLKAVNIKSVADKSLFRFVNLSQELSIQSIDELFSDCFLGDFEISVVVSTNITYDDISAADKLELLLAFLDSFEQRLMSVSFPKKGSLEFYPKSFAEIFGMAKTKVINPNNQHDSIAQNNAWYVLDGFVGTSEEQGLIEFIQSVIGNLQEKYSEYYLLRNEEVYKIYDFEQGRGFQPDFILFLKGKTENSGYYQIFIEPKGNDYIGSDGTFKTGKEGWKDEFLEQISTQYGLSKPLVAENNHYKLIGLPFYNIAHDKNFNVGFNQLIS